MTSPAAVLHPLLRVALLASVVSSLRAQAAVHVDFPSTLAAAIASVDNPTAGG